MLHLLAQVRPLPHTTFPTPPGSASVLPAARGPLPTGLPRVNGRWLARCAPPTRPALPTSAGRGCGSAGRVPDLLPVAALLLALVSHPPHAARPPFHTAGRNPALSMPHPGSYVRRWPLRHSCRLLPIALPGHTPSPPTTAPPPEVAPA